MVNYFIKEKEENFIRSSQQQDGSLIQLKYILIAQHGV